MNRSFRNKLIVLVVLVAILSGGALWFMLGKKNGLKNTRIGEVKKGELVQRATIAGEVIPNRKIVITAPYDGYIRNLYVKVNQRIRKDDPVVSVIQSLHSDEQVFPIRAPFSGRVVQVRSSAGENVKKNDSENFIARIDDLRRLFVDASVPEIEYAKIKIGQEAVVKIAAILNHKYKGIVREKAQAANTKKWNRAQVEFPVKIEIMDKDGKIKPGMSAIIDVIANRKENVLTLGHEFIQKDADQFYVVMENGERRDIEVGIKNEEMFEITKGVAEGDRIRQVDFVSLLEKEKK